MATGKSYLAAGIRWKGNDGKQYGLCKQFRHDEDARRFLKFMEAWFGD